MSEDLNFVLKARREKLAQLEALGVQPFAYGFDATHDTVTALRALPAGAEEGPRVSVAGRLVAWRPHGKTIFGHVADSHSRLQVYFRRDELGDAVFAQLALFDIGDIVGVEGTLFRTRTGETTVKVERATLLAKSLRPLPYGKDEIVDGTVVRHSGFADPEMRYRQRYADLAVNADVRRRFVARSRMTTEIRRALDALGYLEVETPVLQPLYGGAAARPFVTHHNALDMTLYLRIADELYLKRLVVGGLDRVYEIGHDFRNEGIDRTHNPEFTMLEFYEAYADYETMMDTVEQLICTVVTETFGGPVFTYLGNEIDVTPPWPRKSLRDAIREGSGMDYLDYPDAGSLLAAARQAGADIETGTV
ncbi:MAG: lysine--tRNA ligase, partial [Gemmatimonadota bacterium]